MDAHHSTEKAMLEPETDMISAFGVDKMYRDLGFLQGPQVQSPP